MSRTIRRKSGDRWFARKRNDYVKLAGKVKYVTAIDWEACKVGQHYSTYPRKVVCRPWVYVYTKAEFDKKLEAEWTRDKYLSTPWSQDLKWHSNKVSRADQREQLHLIMRGQEHYDDSYELKFTKGLAWMYD